MHVSTPRARFAGWLAATMQSRGLSQAQLARSVGVADTQVSRWRRGQVVPTVQYLQRIADAFGVDRATLDKLVGYPVAETREGADVEPEVEAELQAHQARLREAMQRRLPRSMWRAYVDACVALADGLGSSARRIVRESLSSPEPPAHGDRPLGFSSRPTHEPPSAEVDPTYRPFGFRTDMRSNQGGGPHA